jgi:hypothetical protein
MKTGIWVLFSAASQVPRTVSGIEGVQQTFVEGGLPLKHPKRDSEA